MKRLIVNADDLGRAHGINTGVFEAHQRGIVTSATAMVNHEFVREAALMSLSNPRLGIGLHVALTGGRPALPPAAIPSLVDAEGRQPARPEGLSGANPRDLAAEVAAQFAKFVSVFGRRPTHLDSHHHSHRRPEVFEALCALARLEDLPVRNAGGAMGGHLKMRGLRANDWFEERFFDQGVSVPTLVSILDSLPDGATEMMCHPAHADAELAVSSTYAAARVLELQALCDPAVRDAVERAGIQLMTFSDL
jgi:predicted glycoside hydrolase/deacetylase ChbG (UPF0249 family)